MKVATNGNNRTRQLLGDLGRAIVSGYYSADKPFPTESELCDTYGVSRSIVREVVKMLSSKGLLASRARKGTWVLPPQERNVLDHEVLQWMLTADRSLELLTEFVQIRREIEPAAAALAASHASEDQIQALYDSLDNMRNSEEDESLDADIEFHISILTASGNRFMQQMRYLVECALKVSIELTNQCKGVPHASIDDHLVIADAIKNGDSQLARLATLKLIDESYELLRLARQST